MIPVTADLGSAIQAEFGASTLPGARVRFRLGGTFQLLGGGVQGSGWGVDDLHATSILSVGACGTVSIPPAGNIGSTLGVAYAPGGDITLTWGGSCAPGDTDYAIYEGMIGSFYSHGARFCGSGGATALTFTPAAGGRYYLVVPGNGQREGSYGQRSGGVERPQGSAACFQKEVAATCP